MSAAIGGTAEALGGGKFANGAVTGAYVMMFNHLGQKMRQRRVGKLFETMLEDAGLGFSILENGVYEISVKDAQRFEELAGRTGGSIDKKAFEILSRNAKIYATAKVGGWVFFGVESYQAYQDVTANPSFVNIAENTVDISFSAYATFGGWKGIAVWAIYRGGKWYYTTGWEALRNPYPDPIRNPFIHTPGFRPGR
ncbi:MAG: hypothetical protein ACOC4J_02890 [Bacteroidota bacterium]